MTNQHHHRKDTMPTTTTTDFVREHADVAFAITEAVDKYIGIVRANDAVDAVSRAVSNGETWEIAYELDETATRPDWVDLDVHPWLDALHSRVGYVTVALRTGAPASTPPGLARDRHGFLYDPESSWPCPLTECCNAAVSIFSDDGVTYCKRCYADADPMLGGLVSF